MIKNAQEIKAAVKMQEVLAHYGIAVHGRKNIPCPIHQGADPNFQVKEDYCRCYSQCQKTWDPIGFVMDFDTKTYPEALQILAGVARMQVQYSGTGDFQKANEKWKAERDLKEALYLVNHSAWKFWQEATNLPELQKKLEGIDKKYTDQIVKKFGIVDHSNLPADLFMDNRSKEVGITSISKDGNPYNTFFNRIIFPIREESGKICGFTARDTAQAKAKYINSPESSIFEKRKILYGIFENRKAIQAKDFVYLVEGPTDVIALVEHEIHNCLAAMGTAFTRHHAEKIKRYTNTVVMLYDGDGAGEKAAINALPHLLAKNIQVSICLLPPGHDPDSFVREEGEEVFRSYADSNNQNAVIWAIMKNFDPKDPFSKSQAVTKAAALIAAMPMPSLRESYIDQLCSAKMLGNMKKVLKDEINSLLSTREEYTVDLQMDQQNDLNKYGFYEKNNCYYVGNSAESVNSASNFIIKPIMLVLSRESSYRLVEVINENGESFVKDVPAEDFVELGTFKKQIESQGNFIWKADPNSFLRIKQKIYNQTPTCFKINVLGWQKKGFWAWANGLSTTGGKFLPVDKYGIAEFEGEKYFLPPFSSIYNSFMEEDNDFEAQKSFMLVQEPAVTLAQWMEEFVSVFGTRGIIAASWYMSAVFRDIIMEKNKCFPHLFSFGPTGSGKSFLAWSITALFGKYQAPFHLMHGTNVGFFRRLSQYRNIITWFDEYKNDLHFSRVEALKAAFDGTGHEKGVKSQDNRTTKTKPNASLLISGQHQPTKDPALFNRCIVISFEKKEHTQEEKRRAAELNRKEKKGIFSQVTMQLLQYREAIEEGIGPALDDAISTIKQVIGTTAGLDDRILMNHAVPLAVFSILKEEGLDIPLRMSELSDALISNAKHQSAQISSEDEIGVFWQLLEYFISDHKVTENIDYQVERHGNLTVIQEYRPVSIDLPSNPKILFLRLSRIHALYMEFIKRQRNELGLGKDALIHYLKQAPGYLGYQKSKNFDGKAKGCYVFQIGGNHLDIELDVTNDAAGDNYTAPEDDDKKEDAPF